VKASEITVEYGEAPWRVSVAKSEAFLKHPSGKPKSAMIAIDSMENYGKPNPYNPAWAEFMDIYHPILDELWLDKTTPEDACKRITEKANEMLVEFYEKLEEK